MIVFIRIIDYAVFAGGEKSMTLSAKEKRIVKKQLTALQNDVYRNVVLYLIGNKYVGPYELINEKYCRIKIDTGYGCPKLYLYFDWRIRVSIFWKDVTETTNQEIK